MGRKMETGYWGMLPGGAVIQNEVRPTRRSGMIRSRNGLSLKLRVLVGCFWGAQF